jgi:hypothetical protein
MLTSGGAGDPMTWGAAVFLAVFLMGTGLMLIVAGRRAAAGRLRQNRLVGVRTTLTLSSQEAWDAAQLAGGRRLSTSGFGPLMSGPLLLTRPRNGVGATIAFAGLAWMVGWTMAAGAVGRRAAEAAVEDGSP